MNKIKTNINSITGIIMIILSALNLILVKFDYTYRPNNYTVFYVINLIISVVIIFFSIKYKRCAGKTSKIFASFLPIIALVYVVTLFVSNIGESKILQTVKSPDGTYVAVSISHDEGALGGDTCVRVRNNKNQIPLLLGSVIREEQQLWTGPWGKTPNIKWEDDDTLLINNVSYDIE
ncbi:MAG: hypothetical protein J6V58_05140 [Clostridia bacterium]|nr:hypothetical protein [Clostridia bacterium]